MNGKKRDMDMNRILQTGENIWADTDLLLSPEDQVLFHRIGEFIRAEADIEEIKNDPSYGHISNSVMAEIKNHDTDNLIHINNRDFISESLNDTSQDNNEEEIRDIKGESSQSGIDKITSEWVNGWNKNSEKGDYITGRKEIRDFITGSLENKGSGPEPAKVLQLRRILALAAVLAGAIFLIRSLLISDDPARIFTRYYEPMNIVSSVTRGTNVTETDRYNQAVESYKAQYYREAAAAFSLAAGNGNQADAARFFLGLSRLALENYGEAVNNLESVVNARGEYLKDATWYLGLAYLKSGEPGKAVKCFETLSETPGFYRDRAGKILRRLK